MKGFFMLTITKRAQYKLLYESLQHGTAALNFTMSMLEPSYKSHFPDHANEVTPLLEGVWNHLLEANSGDELYQACGEAHQKFFASDDIGSWFNRGYSAYKSQRKPVQD